MRINPSYLNNFKKTKDSYLYEVSRGIYLKFDIETLEYKGVELMFNPMYFVDKLCDEKLEELYFHGILD